MARRFRKGPAPFDIAFGAGVLGAFAFTLLMALARGVAMTTINWEVFLGSILTRTAGMGTWIVGFIWHLINGGVFGLIYAAAFRAIGRSGADVGAAVGLAHWVFAGFYLGFLPAVNPLMPEIIPAPGFYGLLAGTWSAVLVLVVHMIFGAIVGGVCRTSAAARGLPTSEAEEAEREREERVA